jgi:hypothetical protein
MPRIFCRSGRDGDGAVVTTVGCNRRRRRDPLPSFTASPTAGSVPLTVGFADRSVPGGPHRGVQGISATALRTQRNPERPTIRPAVHGPPDGHLLPREFHAANRPISWRSRSHHLYCLMRMGTVVVARVKIAVPRWLTRRRFLASTTTATSAHALHGGHVRLSDSFTIQHNNGSPTCTVRRRRKDHPHGVSIPTIPRVPATAWKRGRFFILALWRRPHAADSGLRLGE